MNELNITSAQYLSNLNDENTSINVRLEGYTNNIVVPIDPANMHYAEILRQVEEGTLTIADAD